MKRIALLFLMSCAALVASAQTLSLTGTSYTQNFNGLASGLPTGWHVFTYATPNQLGIIQDTSSKLFLTPSNSTKWNNTTGGFKNFASANNSATYMAPFGLDSAAQATATDRALGIRQVSGTSTSFPGTDSGAAFALLIANTSGLTSFNMSFKLQSLDSTSTRTATWRVDYGVGLIPTSFTSVSATGTVTTGGSLYRNNTVTVSFGSALNNISGPVWVRIVTVNNTSGTGNRPSTAIDDVNLTWTGTAAGSPRPTLVSMTPTPNATGVAPGTNLVMTFDRDVISGAGNIYVKNRNTQVTTTIGAASSSVGISGNTVTISGFMLVNAATFHVTFDSTAFSDTTGAYRSYGLYDTTAWKFSTAVLGYVGNVNAATLPLTAINPASDGAILLSCNLPQAAILNAHVYDLNGREVSARSFNAVKGDNRLPLQVSLPAGTYIIRVDNGKEWGSVKVTMQ